MKFLPLKETTKSGDRGIGLDLMGKFWSASFGREFLATSSDVELVDGADRSTP